MPAPKRGSTPHDSQPKMRKLDEDGEALPTKIESATNSLITEKKQENTAAAPRTKIKRLLVEKGNTPAKSSKQSSPPKDSSKSPSDPPVKKAKLLTATSASCGEAPLQRANSKASLKRTTSTESDEDLSSDGSKVEFFREKDDEDEARCIRKYANKAKRKVEELSSDPQETSQDLSSSPSDPVQIDHSYDRFSDSTSLQNTGVAEDKDSAVSFTERESQEISHNATQKVPTDTSTSETGSAETSVKVESATDKHKDVELQYQESQTLVDHKTPAFSREMADCVTPVGGKKEKQDETESIKSQNGADDKTLASPEKTLCAVTGDIISGVQVVDGRTDSCQSESQTCLTVQSVSEENELNIKCKTKEQEVSETAGICADKLDGVLLDITSSAPDHVEISPSDSQPKENVRMAEFTSSNTQIDLSCQLASREVFDASDIQAEMPEKVVSLCDVNKTLEHFEESPRDGVDFESPQTSACSEAVVEVHLNHGAVTPDSCTDTLSECVVLHEENQVEMLSDHLKVPEGQITPEVVLQSDENCLFNEKLAKVATLAEGDSTGKERCMSSVQCSAAEIKGDVQTSHPDVTEKTQNQDAHESITDFHEAHSAKKIEPLENEETVGAEYGSEAETQSVIATQTVVTPEISNSEPPMETRKQEIQEVSESTTVPSTEIHSNVAAEKCENMETVECAVITEGQSGMETHLVATFELYDPDAKVELQIQESPVSERTAVVLEGEKDPENANSESSNDGECVDFTAENLIEVDKQTVIVSEEVCTQIKEAHSLMNQEVSEHTIDVCDKAQKVVENAYCATQTLSPSQIEVNVLAAATSEEVSNVACIEETQTPMVSEPTTETYKVQNELENVNCAGQIQIKVVDNVQAAATSENVSNVAPLEQMQITTDSEPVTDAPDDAYTDLENAAFKSGKDVRCVSAAARSLIEVVVDTSASENVSIEVMQSQIVREPTMHTSVKFMGDHWEEHLKTVENNEFKFDCPAVTLSQMEMGTTLAVESSSPTPASCVNKSQTEEDMHAPENSSSTAFVVETQTPLIIQDVSGQTRDNSNKELHENIIVENLQKVTNKDEVHSGCVTEQEDRLKSEMQVTPASAVLEADHSVEIHKSPNEMHMQTVTSDQDSVFPAVEMQNLQSHDVMEEHIDTMSVADEESRNKMETTETSVLSPSAETQYQISNNVNDSSANVSEQVQANFRISANENKAVEECVRTAVGTNKMETQSAEGLQGNSQPTTTKQIPSQRGQEVCELTTDTNSLVLQSSAETQIQKSFSIAESFTVPSTVDHENKSEECIDTAETTHEMETQSPQMLEVPQPTTSENTQIQRGQELSELTTDISVSPPPPETQIQRSCDVTELSSEGSTTVQEDVKIHSNVDDENENKAIEYIYATDRTYKMEIQTAEELQIQTAEELQEILPTTTAQSEATELTTDISASPPSSETHAQKNLNITESATNTFVCNENTAVEKSLGATERTIDMEMQAAEMLLEVSQPGFTKQRQKLRGQEVCELTTDTNVSFLPSSSETEIQKCFIVTSPANDASETVQESFCVPLNRHHENGNEVLTECGSTAGRTNKMETQSVQMLEEASQATITEQTQNQRVQEFSEVTTDASLSVSPASAEMQIHRSLDVSKAPTNVSATVQEMFKISSSECRENEKKAFEKCADTAEMTNETEMQTSEALEETLQPPTTKQTQNQRGQKVIELTIDADVSVAPLLAGTTIQRSMDIAQSASDKSITFQENFKISPNEINKNENKAMTECVHTSERTNKMETHPPELLQEICQPSITEQTQNQINDPISTEREQNQNYVITSENHPKINIQTSLTPEVYHQKSEVELQNQRNTDVSEEMDASECENVPEIETDMEASAKSEISYLAAVVDHKKHLAEETTEHTMHLSDEILTPQPIVNYENEHDGQTEPANDHGDVISRSMERTDSALEEGMKVEASVRSAEGGTERSEVIVFVCNQSDDTVIQAPEEQIKTVHQTEVEFYENQVVYEPISSPESNSGEVCTPIQLGETISFLDLQSAETHHILSKESNFLTRDDKLVITHPKLEDGEIVKVEMCASDCGAAVLMEVDTTSEAQCSAHVHLEQSNEADDVTHIAATDGRSQSASKQGERWDVLEHIRAAELTEQMQEDTEVHDATVFMATTPCSTEIKINPSSEQMQEDTGIMVITPAPTEVKITDASPEWVQEDTGVQGATVVMATNPSSTEVEITDASSEQVQEDTAVQDATVIMATATLAQTDVEVADASSEQMQEYIEDEEATGLVATATPALTEVEITDASSEQVQEDTGVQDATTYMAAATPAPTEVEVVDASSEQMQEDTGVQDATVVMATATPAPIEIEITDASSEQVQEDTGVQNTTVIMATTTTGPTEVEITDASSEQVHEDTGVQDATVVMATNPSSIEVEMTYASSEHVQEDTGVQDATTYMATASPASTEVEITSASCEQVQESIENEEATGIVATATPALTEVEVVDASSELMHEDIGIQDALVVMTTATTPPIEVEVVDASSEQMQEDTGAQNTTVVIATTTTGPTEVEVVDASSEQMQEDTGAQNTTVVIATTTTGPTEVEITDASSEQVHEDTWVQDATANMATATPALTEVEITDASSEQMQEDTGIQDATTNMATATPAPIEFHITDSSSEQMQQDAEVQDSTVVMATTTPALTEFEITNASSEQVQEDTEVQDTTVIMATIPSPTEVEITDASSEQMQEDTGIQDTTVVTVTATPAPTEVEITDASSEQMQEDTGIQDATTKMATATPAPIEFQITDASSEQMQQDTGVQDSTVVMATTTPALTEFEITNASSEQVQEDTEVQDTTVIMATIPSPTEVEITDASSERVQEDTEVQDTTVVTVTATPAPTEVEITNASSEQMQEDTGIQDATTNMATATPAPIEFQITDASSEQMQQDTGVQDATTNMATATPAPIEFQITNASSERVQDDTEVQDTTVIMATIPSPTEVEITDASSERVQEDTEVQDTTFVMATATPAPTEVEITDASSEQMQEDTGIQDATTNMATATPAPIEFQITDASSEQMQQDTGVQDSTVVMATTTPALTEFEITNASSEQVQEDTEVQDTTVIMATIPSPTEVEITDASSERVQEDTEVQDTTVVTVTATPAPTEVEITNASSERVQDDTEVQNTTVIMATIPSPTEVEITDASSEHMQQDTGVQDSTVVRATTTPALTEFKITSASSEQVQEDTGIQDATTNMATATPAPIEFQITDSSSEQMQQDTGVQDSTVVRATTTPALTEFKITSASSEQVQEDTGIQDATTNMATATPAPIEFQITDASSEQMQQDAGVQDSTVVMATTTPALTEFKITNASSEQVQEDTGVQDTTVIMATIPAPTEVEITNDSSDRVQEDTEVPGVTIVMVTATPELTEGEITDASSEQMQEDTGIKDATTNMVTATPAPIEFQITDASSEQVQEDTGIQDATIVMVTATPEQTEGEITDASSEQVPGATVVMVTTTRPTEVEVEDGSSEQMQVDTGIQDTTANMVTTPELTEGEITDASSEQVQEDTGFPDATDNMVTTTSASTEGEVANASAEDYVILEPVPVPVREIHFDIVTQAVAESGLSASLGPDEEMASQSILNSSPQTIILEAVAHQAETTDEVNNTTVTSSGDVLEQETEKSSLQDAPVSDHQPSSASVDVEMVNCHHTNNDSTAAVMENVECALNQDEVQILEVMEIGREVVVMEEDNKEDSDVVIIKPPAQPTEGSKKSEKEVNVTKKQNASKTVKKKASAGKVDEIKGKEVEKPKKQEMNMQARTKARLAALAEQKAAAAKRSANRQQLNLLALCEEIAEDIATDSMLLKKIEEEKQAAAAAAEAAKAKAIKKEHPDVTSQEAEPDNVVTPAGPEESPASETPTPEVPAVQPSTADSAEPKPAAEPPKRRFFISQISVPLKAHEKKKLTRYQRLRQVELQREKMSWARVKKLKSDQTNQMFSDVDWQASFSGGFFMGSATPPQASSPSKTPPVSQTTATQPAQPKGDSPKTETSELVKTEVDKTEPTKTENTETELDQTETIKTEPAKAETSKTEPVKTETSKTEPVKTETCTAEPVKAETPKTEAPNFDNRRITRQSKAQASKAAVVAPKPAPKVTRSTSKRSLPAVPPPMPNGLNAQKPKPVEYKPYRPRPKYSFDDFELDDDDSLLVSTIKPNLSTQPPRPCPTAQCKPPLKPTITSQPANQAKVKSQTAPPGPTRPTAAVQAHLQSAKSKPTVAAAAQLKPTTAASSKPVPSTSTQLKTPILAASQSKPASAQPKPAACASPQLKPAGVNVTKQFAPAAPHPDSPATTETKPAAAKTGDASAPQKTENPPSQENETCTSTADPLSSLPASSLPSVESADGTKTSDESPADTAPNSSAENETKTAKMAEKTSEIQNEAKPQDAVTFLSDASLQKEVKKLKEADKDGTQTIIDAGQKHFGPVACSGCGMLYSAANPEDESQHLLFHNQFVSAVKYVGWKKERILAEFPDGKIILVLPDDPKYALKKVEEIREMVDNDLGFQQVETKCPSQTKTFLFISIDKKVAGCLIAEHIQEGYRVIEEALPEGSEGEKVLFERQKAWCCSTTPDPAICGISRIWVVSMMRRRGIATRMIECLRNNFIYGSYLRKDEIAFSDPTPDGKLFASHYFGTSQFLVYNFVSGLRSLQPKTQAV